MPESPAKVSIVILNYNHPHNITRLLPSISMISGNVVYETIVVDNGSTPDVVKILEYYKTQGFIDKLVLSPINTYFSGGCNLGVSHSDPSFGYILLLNNDTEILRGELLERMVEWSNGIPKTLLPYTWSDHPAEPQNVKRGIVSIDWAYDLNVPGYVRPEGWCCLIRREAWRDMSTDFPMNMGDMEMMANAIRDGHPCGCLSQYGKYITHYHGGSPATPGSEPIVAKRQADPRTWWQGLTCESLDFALGPFEKQSYLEW